MSKTRKQLKTINLLGPTSLSNELITDLLDGIKTTMLSSLESEKYVIRSRRHTIAWMISYFVTEIAELNDEFVADKKAFSTHLLRYDNEIRLVFRLRSLGIPGWTEYGISVLKIGDVFACEE